MRTSALSRWNPWGKNKTRWRLAGALAVCAAAVVATRGLSAASEVILYSSDFTAVNGRWTAVSTSTAAEGKALLSTDQGWAAASAPLASPGDYVEASFDASANTAYHVWVRMSAGSNSKYNDSVWVQFSDSVNSSGSAIHRIGSTTGLLLNLQSCDGCAMSGWGWLDGAYWLQQTSVIRFASTGTHKIRIQTREDGVAFDQVVISPATFLSSAPGIVKGDNTIVSKTLTSLAGLTPYSGVAPPIPGTIRAETFDNGGEGVAYHDTSAGNNGGKVRSTDVDIESSSDGGYDIGWTTSGEWLNYTVNVGASGSYNVGLRVAAPNGATMHVGFNRSNVWTSVTIPKTSSWQSWTTVTIPATLTAGTQQMTIFFDNGGVNLNRVVVSQGSVAPPPPPPPTSGDSLSVATWNLKIDGTETHARVAMDTLMNIGPRPNVVVVQEAHSAMFNIYIDELQRQTGQTWHGVFATHCEAGKWNGSSCTATWYQGVGIFTTLPIVNSSSTLFPYADCWTSARAALRAGISVNGIVLQVFTTHLQTGSCTDVKAARNASMSKLKTWTSNYSKPQILAGDFNADPDQIDTTTGMLPNFLDTWSLVGSGRGFSAFTSNPTMKLDYWFTDSGRRAEPSFTQVYVGAGTRSDHYPVQTTFTVR